MNTIEDDKCCATNYLNGDRGDRIDQFDRLVDEALQRVVSRPFGQLERRVDQKADGHHLEECLGLVASCREALDAFRPIADALEIHSDTLRFGCKNFTAKIALMLLMHLPNGVEFFDSKKSYKKHMRRI